MKVCMVAYAQYFSDARIKSYVQTLVNSGCTVDVLSLAHDVEKSQKDLNENVSVFCVAPKYQGSSALLYMASYLYFFVVCSLVLTYRFAQRRYDVVHVHNMPNFIVFCALIPKIFGSKVILDIHDLMTINFMVKFGVEDDHWLIKVLKAENRLSAAFADTVICADHKQNEYLENHIRVRPDKLNVIMNLPHKDLFPVRAKSAKDDLFKVVYHGTLAERLGINVLLKAASMAGKEIPMKLFIYGSGDYLGPSLRLADDLNLGGSVFFSKCFFPVEDIPGLIENMDLGVVPYRKNLQTDRYGMSVKLMEYAYMEIPVVAPKLEIIKFYFSNDMVKYFEPDNAADLARCFVECFEHPYDSAQRARKALGFFDKYNWETQETYYLSLLNGS